MKPRVLLLDGSIGGREGNTSELLRRACSVLESNVETETICLVDEQNMTTLKQRIRSAQGLVFGTGTYWDSWGSPLQQFFEGMTETERSDLWLGKPAVVFVTMHSVGGKAVLSRLQGTLNLFGVLIPPMGGLVYSALAHEALANGPITTECWQLEDVEVVCHNLQQALQNSNDWRRWPTDSENFERKWIRDT